MRMKSCSKWLVAALAKCLHSSAQGNNCAQRFVCLGLTLDLVTSGGKGAFCNERFSPPLHMSVSMTARITQLSEQEGASKTTSCVTLGLLRPSAQRIIAGMNENIYWVLHWCNLFIFFIIWLSVNICAWCIILIQIDYLSSRGQQTPGKIIVLRGLLLWMLSYFSKVDSYIVLVPMCLSRWWSSNNSDFDLSSLILKFDQTKVSIT